MSSPSMPPVTSMDTSLIPNADIDVAAREPSTQSPDASLGSLLQRQKHRTAAVLLAACAVTLFGLSLGQSWWQLKLYAPQYPHGLQLHIGLTGLSGDVHEIDMLNHYIGMAHLDAAAAFERRYARVAVAMLSLAVFALSVWASRRTLRAAALLGALFPLGFIADSFFWLHRFGHHMDPRAPLHIPAFTPQLFGNGSIGQFMTFASPERGFWLAVGGAVVLLGMAVWGGRATSARGVGTRSGVSAAINATSST